MFYLILAACLTADPATCEPRLLPAGEAALREDCELRASAIATDWLARHPDLSGGTARCVPTDDLPALELSEIAPGVRVFQGAAGQLSPQNRGRIANLGVIVGDSVAVIDAGATRAEAEALYAAIRRVTDKPVSHVILTHMHPDHILGAEVFSEAGATIVADERLPEAVARRAGTWARTIPEQIGMATLAGSNPGNVDQPVAGRMTLDLGSRQLELRGLPVGHAGNDLTVYDTASGTLFAGDMIFQGLTPSLDGSLLGWLDWLEAAPEPRPRRIVPGHGPVSDDWDAATGPTAAYLAALRDATRAALQDGVAMSQAVPRIVQAMQPLAGEWQDFSATTARNAATAFAELEWE